jgi:hypothetical protein
MTDRENYLSALLHQRPERIPIYEKPVLVQIGFMDPFEKGPAGGGLDGFGVRWLPTESADGAVVPASDHFLMEYIDEWEEKITFPDLEAVDWKAKAEKDLSGIDLNNKVFEYGMGNAHFERMAALMGFENALCALVEDPESCLDYMEAYTDYRIKLVDKIAEYYHPDCICNYDDVATQRSLFMSPEVYRKIISPFHKKVNDAIRAHGIYPIQHCCGKAEDIIGDFISEGAVAWTSVQPCNDIARLIQEYGDRITIVGGFDSNGFAGGVSATTEDRKAEARRAIDEYGHKGSFILGNLNFMTGQGPEQTNAILEEVVADAAEYGKNLTYDE